MTVHGAHCCKKHGCKYRDPDCPVVLGKEEGIICDECEEDEDWLAWAELDINKWPDDDEDYII